MDDLLALFRPGGRDDDEEDYEWFAFSTSPRFLYFHPICTHLSHRLYIPYDTSIIPYSIPYKSCNILTTSASSKHSCRLECNALYTRVPGADQPFPKYSLLRFLFPRDYLAWTWAKEYWMAWLVNTIITAVLITVWSFSWAQTAPIHTKRQRQWTAFDHKLEDHQCLNSPCLLPGVYSTFF